MNTNIPDLAQRLIKDPAYTLSDKEQALLLAAEGSELATMIYWAGQIRQTYKNSTICGGREITLNDFQSWIFNAGSNAVMSGDYLTTEGRSIKEDMEMTRHLGLKVSADNS